MRRRAASELFCGGNALVAAAVNYDRQGRRSSHDRRISRLVLNSGGIRSNSDVWTSGSSKLSTNRLLNNVLEGCP
jgi:hypothetical protein